MTHILKAFGIHHSTSLAFQSITLKVFDIWHPPLLVNLNSLICHIGNLLSRTITCDCPV